MSTQKWLFLLVVILFGSSSISAVSRSTFEFEVDEIRLIEDPLRPGYRIRIIRTGSLSQPASVVLSTVDGTAHGTHPFPDFTGFSFRLDFAPNQSVREWYTWVVDDDDQYEAVYEGTEWFMYRLSDPSSNSQIGSLSSIIARIDDSYDYPKVNVDRVWIIEPGPGRQRQTALRVTLTNPSVEPVSVHLSNTGGTASEGADYFPFATVVNFAPSDREEFVPLTILGDGLPEPRERISLQLSHPVNANPGYLALNFVEIINAAPYSGQPDFDGNGWADLSSYDSATSRWFSGLYQAQPVTFGSSGDVIVPGEFTGDALTDVAVWRPSDGTWFVLRSEDSSYFAFPFGSPGDIPVPADYDADGIADFALFRPSTGTWYIQRSTEGEIQVRQFGGEGDKPVPADYDGDWRADIAVFRGNGAAAAQWWITNSSDGEVVVNHFGLEGDKVVPLDYTGDGKADLSVWRPSTQDWYVLNSSDNSVSVIKLGEPTSIPAPADYDYRNGPDFAVLTPAGSTSTSQWAIRNAWYGWIDRPPALGDRPLAGAYVR